MIGPGILIIPFKFKITADATLLNYSPTMNQVTCKSSSQNEFYINSNGSNQMSLSRNSSTQATPHNKSESSPLGRVNLSTRYPAKT